MGIKYYYQYIAKKEVVPTYDGGLNAGMLTNFPRHLLRFVSLCGETLIVRDHFGTKVLTDPCDESIVVLVPSGRRAKLIRFTFSGPASSRGRDADVIVTQLVCGSVEFSSARHSQLRVLLQDLTPGQQVDVQSEVDPAAAFAAVTAPLPVLHGAVAIQPVYAACAA